MNFNNYQKIMSLGSTLQERRVIKKMIMEEGETPAVVDPPKPTASEPDKAKAISAMNSAKEAFTNTAGLNEKIKNDIDNIINDILNLDVAKVEILTRKFNEIDQPAAPDPADNKSSEPSRDTTREENPEKGSEVPSSTTGNNTNTITATDPKADSRFEKWRKGAANQLGKIGKSLGDKFRGSPGSNPQSDDDEPGTAPGNRRRAQSGSGGERASSEENEAREIIRGKEALSFIDQYGLEKMKRLMDDKKIDVRIIIL